MIKQGSDPVIFISGHFNNFELMAMQIEKLGINLAAVYRPLNNIFLNPISPHIINMRPFLINDTSSIKIIVKEKDYSLSLDSRIYSIDKKSILLIKKSDFTINTIEFAEDNFFKKLRDRLFWGQDMRNTDSINK